MLGSSFIYWANKEAATRPGGLDLGLQFVGGRVTWMGTRSMHWQDFQASVSEKLQTRPAPSFLLIHLGSNDLGVVSSSDLYEDIELDILRLHAMYPNIKIIWSEMLMRRYWHNADVGKCLENARKRVNLRVRNLVVSIGGYVIRHPNIRSTNRNLYRYDGCHMSTVGNNIYLNTVQGAIETFMKEGGPHVFPPIDSMESE